MQANNILKLSEIYLSKILKYAEDEKNPSAGMLIYCLDDNSIFLTLRSMEMKSPNTWDIPGGRADKDDDDTIDTATREVTEEINSIPKNKKLLGKKVLSTPGGGNQYVIYVYAISKQEKKKWTPQVQLDFESETFKWFPYDKLPSKTHLDLTWVKDFIDNHTN